MAQCRSFLFILSAFYSLRPSHFFLFLLCLLFSSVILCLIGGIVLVCASNAAKYDNSFLLSADRLLLVSSLVWTLCVFAVVCCSSSTAAGAVGIQIGPVCRLKVSQLTAQSTREKLQATIVVAPTICSIFFFFFLPTELN